MHNTKKIKLILFISIMTGFFMITTLCIRAKNKSHVIWNNYESAMIGKDTTKKDANLIEALTEGEDKIDFPNKGKAWRMGKSFTLSY